MNDERTLREIARLALMRLPADARARTIGQILIEDQEPHVLDRLAKLRAVISLRMQGLIEARFPQDDLSASPACDRAGKYATAPDEHPCYISGDEAPRCRQTITGGYARNRSDLRAPAATVELREPASPRVLPIHLRAGWQRLRAAHDRLNDSFAGDVMGAVCVVLTAAIILVSFLAA